MVTREDYENFQNFVHEKSSHKHYREFFLKSFQNVFVLYLFTNKVARFKVYSE